MESKVFLAVGFQLFVWDIVCLSPCVRSANDTIDHKSEHLPRKQNDNRCSETSLTPARPCGDGSGKFETGDFQHFPGFSATFVSLPSAFFRNKVCLPAVSCSHILTYLISVSHWRIPPTLRRYDLRRQTKSGKNYLVPKVIWVEPHDEVEMRRSFLSGVAEENFGVLNVSGWKPAADVLLIYCQDRDHNICIHKRLTWEPRRVNVIHQPFHWACLSISLSSTAGNDLCLSVNDPSVSLCLIVRCVSIFNHRFWAQTTPGLSSLKWPAFTLMSCILFLL